MRKETYTEEYFLGKDRMMDEKLKRLFDYQKFSHNSRLDAMLAQARTQSRSLLSEEEAAWVAAAGRPEEQELPKEKGGT